MHYLEFDPNAYIDDIRPSEEEQIAYFEENYDRYLDWAAANLRKGGVVEMGATERVFGNPVHPYTRTLLASRYLEKTSRPVHYLLGAAVLESAEAWRHRETARQFEGQQSGAAE